MSDQNWTTKRIQTIVNHYGAEFFANKKILDVGSGNGTIARAFADMGAKVTCIDARKTNLDAIAKSNPSIRCIKADLDQEWPFSNETFDLTLHLSTLNHLMYIEKHLQSVCQISNYLVLDVQVCDYDNNSKFVLVKENKSNVNYSYNGVGCKPSPAFIERILSNCGMEFKLLTNSSCNSDKYIYDWTAKNSGLFNHGLSRLWFAQRNVFKSITDNKISPQKIVTALKESVPSPSLVKNNDFYNLNNDECIKNRSKEFGLIFPEQFAVSKTFSTSGVILPLSVSSKLWLKKIIPFFPNLRISTLAHTMRDFNKSKAAPDLVMSSINNLFPGKRIWIEEWDNYDLTPDTINRLKNYELIMTPSLVNEHQIKMSLPNANVKKIGRTWPLLNGDTSSSHYIYFEKNSNNTSLLCDAWKAEYGNLVIVGSTVKTSNNFTHILDTENYKEVCDALRNAKALIDISNNYYYISGLFSLAKSLGLQIISNNQLGLDPNRDSLISQDQSTSPYPSIEQIQKAIDKLNINIQIKNNINNTHNNLIDIIMQKMLGYNA